MEWVPLITVEGMRSIGPANSMFFIRLSTSDTRAAAYTKATFAPRQKWVPPPPNAKCGLGLRVTSKRSGSMGNGNYRNTTLRIAANIAG